MRFESILGFGCKLLLGEIVEISTVSVLTNREVYMEIKKVLTEDELENVNGGYYKSYTQFHNIYRFSDEEIKILKQHGLNDIVSYEYYSASYLEARLFPGIVPTTLDEQLAKWGVYPS